MMNGAKHPDGAGRVMGDAGGRDGARHAYSGTNRRSEGMGGRAARELQEAILVEIAWAKAEASGAGGREREGTLRCTA